MESLCETGAAIKTLLFKLMCTLIHSIQHFYTTRWPCTTKKSCSRFGSYAQIVQKQTSLSGMVQPTVLEMCINMSSQRVRL